jgi:hypothetical protein
LGAFQSTSSLGKNTKENPELLVRNNISTMESADQSSNFEAYNEGGTTYYISGAEMVIA